MPELRTTLEIGQKRCRSAFTFSRSERHFDLLEQLCAAAVESRLGVDRHGFELDAVLFAPFRVPAPLRTARSERSFAILSAVLPSDQPPQ